MFLRFLAIGDEAAFQMNGIVTTRNVRCYAPKHHPIGTRLLQIDVKRETFGVDWLMRKRGAHRAILFRRRPKR